MMKSGYESGFQSLSSSRDNCPSHFRGTLTYQIRWSGENCAGVVYNISGRLSEIFCLHGMVRTSHHVAKMHLAGTLCLTFNMRFHEDILGSCELSGQILERVKSYRFGLRMLRLCTPQFPSLIYCLGEVIQILLRRCGDGS